MQVSNKKYFCITFIMSFLSVTGNLMIKCSMLLNRGIRTLHRKRLSRILSVLHQKMCVLWSGVFHTTCHSVKHFSPDSISTHTSSVWPFNKQLQLPCKHHVSTLQNSTSNRWINLFCSPCTLHTGNMSHFSICNVS